MAKRKTDPGKEGEFRQEAERLALLPVADQKEIVAMYRSLATNPLATKACRANAVKRADTLKRHLRRLNRRKKS